METKAEHDSQAPLSIAEERQTYVRADGSTFTREDIHIRLHVPFRDRMLAALKGPPLSVYLCIALHCGNSKMTAFPSINTISNETGYGRTAVISATKTLSAMGLISITHREHENGDPDSNFYQVRGYATMGEGSTPSVPQVVHLVDGGSTPSGPKEESMEEESIKEQPPAADSPLADAASVLGEEAQQEEEPFYLEGETPTKSRGSHTVESVQVGIRQALEKNARNGGRPGVADPSNTDVWANDPLKAFCALVHRRTLKKSECESWPRELANWAAEWHATPQETVDAIKAITQSELDWQTYKTPFSDSFKETMDMMIDRLRNDMPVNAKGQRKGGSSTPRQEQPTHVEIEEPIWLGVTP